MKTRIERLLCDSDQAASLINDGQTVACGGFVGAAHPEALTAAIERRFLSNSGPRNLTLVYAAGQGDGKTRGLNHLAHEGLIKRVIGGHWGLVPGLGRMALAGQIEAYNFPQGVICQLLRDIAAGRPGCITHVGLGTFIDPVHRGGRLNNVTQEELVSRIELDGQTWLFYRAFPIQVGLIRATAADPFGNLMMDEEAVIGEVLPIAQAAHNSGGTVIAQVRRLLDRPAPPHQVKVPGILVDHVVVASEDEHTQTFAESLNASYFSARCNDDSPGNFESEKLASGARRIIAARACDELLPGAIANLGIGMPEGVALIAAERQMLDQITLTVESGPIGGIPAGGLSFGASAWPEAIIDQAAQFDFYDGGGLDYAALGAAQVDQHGNVNVSKFNNRVAGVGGFVNISQNARRVVFCGTMTSGGLEVDVVNGQLRIISEGTVRKFVEQVEQVSFSGQVAANTSREVLFVTERAVFKLTSDGLMLTEVAPGIDIETQILSVMEFHPIVRLPRLMSASCFL
ncbi:MAG: acyl CoA:acetate/3-ketoacid CoA transferase [Rhodopirellula sp.]|nr:acyl CoA:acetate/3-ketoacid CoA transferase [Rhodopirellula sp.]